MEADTPDTQTPDPLPPVRWDAERCEGRGAVVIGDGKWGAGVTVLVPMDTPMNAISDLVASSLKAALTPSPTPREIADHIDAGGTYEGWDVVGCAWVSIKRDARWWRDRHDQDAPAHGYRLVPLPPAPRWETVQVPHHEAVGELYGEKVHGETVVIRSASTDKAFPSLPVRRSIVVEGDEFDVRIDAAPDGTVPVRRREVPQ